MNDHNETTDEKQRRAAALQNLLNHVPNLGKHPFDLLVMQQQQAEPARRDEQQLFVHAIAMKPDFSGRKRPVLIVDSSPFPR